MITSSRRQFLAQSASLSALGAMGSASTSAIAAMGPNDKFDLVIKGGEVLDPSQNLKAAHDIGVRFGAIEALGGEHPALVPNGIRKLIDLHAHVFPYGSAIDSVDELIRFEGTTTLVSAGDAGANNIAAFRRAIPGAA